MTVRPEHLLSLSRVPLGLAIYAALLHAGNSWLVLPCVTLACAADHYDGIIARRAHRESDLGRLIDNVSDATFLAFAFSGFAHASIWSAPGIGSAVRYWQHANWLPLIGLALSFGTYLVRWGLGLLRGTPFRPSVRGHHAGILNYGLAIVGGVAVVPGVHVTAWLLEPLSVSVALFNVMAAVDSVAGFAAPPRK